MYSITQDLHRSSFFSARFTVKQTPEIKMVAVATVKSSHAFLVYKHAPRCNKIQSRNMRNANVNLLTDLWAM